MIDESATALPAPVCTIIAGPNGAGKTTFALNYLPSQTTCRNFVNADLIASGLSPLNPDRELVTASRLFLQEIRSYVAKGESFAFETTLSGRSYLRMIRELIDDGWRVDLIYLWLPTVELSIERVAERVAHGGHSIPKDVIIRRYSKSVSNLLHNYASICSSTTCLDNSTLVPTLIFTEEMKLRTIKDLTRYEEMLHGPHRN